MKTFSKFLAELGPGTLSRYIPLAADRLAGAVEGLARAEAGKSRGRGGIARELRREIKNKEKGIERASKRLGESPDLDEMILGPGTYKWWKYNGPDVRLAYRAKVPHVLHPGDVFGIRQAHSNPDKIRLVVKKEGYGLSKVFSISKEEAWALSGKSTRVQGEMDEMRRPINPGVEKLRAKRMDAIMRRLDKEKDETKRSELKKKLGSYGTFQPQPVNEALPPKHGTPEYLKKAKAYYHGHEDPSLYSAFHKGMRAAKGKDANPYETPEVQAKYAGKNPHSPGSPHHKAWNTGWLAAGGDTKKLDEDNDAKRKQDIERKWWKEYKARRARDYENQAQGFINHGIGMRASGKWDHGLKEQRENKRTYKIVRLYRDHDRRATVKRGLTLAQAQAHCKDRETSSSTCSNPKGKARTKKLGPWFDSYSEE